MFFPWIKRLGAIGLVFFGASQASAQYGSMAYYGADAGVTHGTPIPAGHGGIWGYAGGMRAHSVYSMPRSPGAGGALLNGTGRYFGFGFSEGYHNCPSGGCETGGQPSCFNGLGGLGLGGGLGLELGQAGCSVPNITAPSAPACNSCQAPISNAPCGNQCFGNYQFHPGHVFGRPSYGNPHYPTDCINWREAVKYDQGPCIPNTVYQNAPYQNDAQMMHSPPVAQPMMPAHQGMQQQAYPQQMMQPRLQPQPQITLPETSPSDAAPGSWPWQKGHGNAPQAAPAAPRNLNQPTPAEPLTPVPGPTSKPAAPVAPVLEALPRPNAADDALLEESDSEPKLELPSKPETLVPAPPVAPAPAVVPPVPAPATAPVVPQPPAPAAEPAPKVEPPPAGDDEDLLSNRRNPIRQPKRR